MFRDNFTAKAGEPGYSTILFLYFMQDQFKNMGNVGNDVMRTWWAVDGGSDNFVQAGSDRKYPGSNVSLGGLSEMYHRYMIATYLQALTKVSYPEYYNAYFEPWWTNPINNAAWAINWSVSSQLLRYRPIINNANIRNISNNWQEFTANTSAIDLVEPLGSRFYAINASSTTTGTLHIEYDNPAEADYSISIFDVDMDAAGNPTAIHNIHRLGRAADAITIPDFSNSTSNRRIIVLVSSYHSAIDIVH